MYARTRVALPLVISMSRTKAVRLRASAAVHSPVRAASRQWPAFVRNVETDKFMTKMYQWAATLTSNGRNMPLALPLRTDQTDDGVLVWSFRPCCEPNPQRWQTRPS